MRIRPLLLLLVALPFWAQTPAAVKEPAGKPVARPIGYNEGFTLPVPTDPEERIAE